MIIKKNMRFKLGLSLFFMCLLASIHPHAVTASTLPVTQSLSGPAGLVLMPSSRMLEDGEFSVMYSSYSPYSQYVVSAQPLPWLQALFKYTDISTRLYGPSIAGNQTYKDKSTDIKLRLLKEDYFYPEITLGINDVGGTGLFSGEYFAASKQYKNLDFTLGLGWGYLGKQAHFSNPFIAISDDFRNRKKVGPGISQTGQFNTVGFFAGEKVALFGGVEYHFESWPVVLKTEYDANNYLDDPGGNLNQSIPINIAAVYSPTKHIDIHAGLVRGDTAMLGITFKTNLKNSGPVKYFDEKPVVVAEHPQSEGSWKEITQQIGTNAGIEVHSVVQDDKSLTVIGTPKLYQDRAKAFGRASRILSNQNLNDINKLVFVEEFNGQELSAVEFDKNIFKKAARLELNANEVLKSSKFLAKAEVDKKSAKTLYKADKNQFDYSFQPTFAGSYGGPDDFLLYQIGLGANANFYLRENTWLSGGLQLGLVDNYEKFEYTAPSNLPRVRTNIKEYLKTSQLRLESLQLLDFEAIDTDFFALAYMGYIESMYGGIGAEVLYRPNGKNWALGMDVNYVKQREFDMYLNFRDYSAITGHLTGYYETGDDILFKLSAGQYLAKDVGMTIDVSRKFKSGAQVGFWATKTNVSAEDFGEGSFDKGFYFSLPMDLFTFKSTRQTAGFKWRFLTRDGGQKLNKAYNLYDITDSRSIKFVKESFDRVLD